MTGGIDESRSVASCESLDLRTSMWSSLPNLVSRRHSHASVMLSGTVIVLGGLGGFNSAVLNTCEQLLPQNNTWVQFPSFTTPRMYFGAAVVMNTIFIAGGHSGYGILSSIEFYRTTPSTSLHRDATLPKMFSWLSLESSLPRQRYGCAALSFQGLLVVLGGDQSSIDTYDPLLATWSSGHLPSMTQSLRPHFTAAVS